MTTRVETGPMFSGKSTALFSHLEEMVIIGWEYRRDMMVFNNVIDNRYGENVISTHKIGSNSKEQIPAMALRTAEDILGHLVEPDGKDYALKEEFSQLKAIFIDEGQFFEGNLAGVIQYIDRVLEVDVYIAGLDTNFKAEVFGGMGDVIARAEVVVKHTAICIHPSHGDVKPSERPATLTQRLVNGEPANYNDPIVVVGAKEDYEARCRDCHEVPGKPAPTLVG